MRQIIKNGTIVTGGGSFPADILIDGEKIAATGTAEEIGKLTQPGDREIDAACLLYTSPSPRDVEESRMPSSA